MLITAFLCVLSSINAYQYGAPARVCKTMIPVHGRTRQSTVAPYTISVEPMHYSSGSTVTVTLMGLSMTKFRGYLLTMRRVEDHTTIVAGFSVPNGAQLLACDGQNNAAVTHKENSTKTSVSFTWTAPAQSKGSLQVVATVVESKLTFWTMIQSHTITPSQITTPAGGQGTTTPAGGQGTTTPAGGQGTTTPAGGQGTTTPAGGQGTTTPARGQGTTTSAGGQGTTTPTGGQGTTTPAGGQGTSTTTGRQGTTTPAGGQGTTTPAGGKGTTSKSAAFTVSSFLGILGAVVITMLML